VSKNGGTPPSAGRRDDEPAVLKVPEIAAVLRVDEKTVRDIISRGELAAMRIGRRGLVRVARAVLDRYLEGRAAPEDK
jgi:excisionase family DNA binding protein